MKRFILATLLLAFAGFANATDYEYTIPAGTVGQVIRFTPPLKDQDRVILNFEAPASDKEYGNVAFANQGEFERGGNNSSTVCLKFRGDASTRTTCGNLSGSISFKSVGGVSVRVGYQAVYTMTGDSNDGIRVKVSLKRPEKSGSK